MFGAGYSEGMATDPTRPAWRSNSPRPLKWAAWYPAEDGAAVADKLIGRPGAELFRMGLVAENAEINSIRDRWPVVLLSHGTGGSAEGLCWLATYLAAKGFISIGVSHHGNTAIEPYLPEGFLCWWERAHADSYFDPRIKAVVELAPAPPVRSFKPESIARIALPVAIIAGQNDEEAPHQHCALWLKENNPSFCLELLGRNIGHYVFLPEATETGKALEPVICCDPAGVDRAAIHRAVAEATERFFRNVL